MVRAECKDEGRGLDNSRGFERLRGDVARVPKFLGVENLEVKMVKR